MMFYLGSLTCSVSRPSQQAQRAKQASEQPPPARSAGLDEMYHSVLNNYEISLAQYRQHPDDLLTFRSQMSELGRQIATLSERLEKTQGSTSGEAAKEAKKSTGPAPSGPVRPSQEPSSPEEIEKRRKATEERFPTVHVGSTREAKTLAGVPKSWIQDSCSRAQTQLARIDHLSQTQPLDRSALDSSLHEFRTILDGFSTPSPHEKRP
jgi:hypothetical protein